MTAAATTSSEGLLILGLALVVVMLASVARGIYARYTQLLAERNELQPSLVLAPSDRQRWLQKLRARAIETARERRAG